ncbi:MAG: PD-(D/E)XK nuclease-like domain-containing protein [Oscillospiraceae bacterium]|nr:PD-(D/E)XK nuclease-like domain-containing protein [Oscillospiraceae bacterium]
MNLTAENYYSGFANFEYMSVSQFKDFNGTFGRMGCEACAMAKIREEYNPEPSTAMLMGSYIDAFYEGTLDSFKEKNPQLFRKDGGLKAEYIKAEKAIERTLRDPLFQTYMSGEKQVIMTGELFGTPWKIKMDSYHPGKAIVDLKYMQSLTKYGYVHDIGYLDFVRYWGYDIQGAIYQEIVYQNTGKRLPFYIAGVSKEEAIDIEVIYVSDNYLQEALSIVESAMPHILQVKRGEVPPNRCEVCEYCRDTKVLKKPIGIGDLTAKL